MSSKGVARIRDFEQQLVTLNSPLHVDLLHPVGSLDAISNRIFNQRLQQQQTPLSAEDVLEQLHNPVSRFSSPDFAQSITLADDRDSRALHHTMTRFHPKIRRFVTFDADSDQGLHQATSVKAAIVA